MSVDTLHGIAALIGLAALTAGAGIAWGSGYALLVCGGILLAAVVTARRTHDPQPD